MGLHPGKFWPFPLHLFHDHPEFDFDFSFCIFVGKKSFKCICGLEFDESSNFCKHQKIYNHFRTDEEKMAKAKEEWLEKKRKQKKPIKRKMMF